MTQSPELVRVPFKLEIPFGQDQPLESLEYVLDIELFKDLKPARYGGYEDPEGFRLNYDDNLARLQGDGFQRNLYSFELWDVVFRVIHRHEEKWRELAEQLVLMSAWYGMDMRVSDKQFLFRLNDEKTAGFGEFEKGYVERELGGLLNSLDIAGVSPSMFHFLNGNPIQDFRILNDSLPQKEEPDLLTYLYLSRRSALFSGIRDEWLHGVHSLGTDYFHIGGDSRYISRGVRVIK